MTDFNTFWLTYPSDLCKKGSKKNAEIVWNRINPSEYSQILINLRELTRASRQVKKMGGQRSDWIFPHVVTWLRGERWHDIEDIKQSDELVDTRKCACGKNAEIVNECWSCHDERTGKGQRRKVEQYAQLCSIGLRKSEEETNHDYYQRCRSHALKSPILEKALQGRAG